MIDLRKLQQEIYANKVAKGFNVTDVHLEFCYTHAELAEAFMAYHQHRPDLGEELADVTIYLLGLAEIVGVDLEQEIVRKVERNQRREYQVVDGIPVRTKEAE